LPEQATKFATVAATLSYHDAQAVTQRATQMKTQLETQQKGLQLFEGLTRGVDSQETLDQANAMYAHMMGAPSPYASVIYSPDTMDQLRNSVLARKDAIANQQKELDRQEREDWHAATNEYRDARLKQHDAEQETRAQREARLAKNGGKPLSAPTKAEFTPALDLVTSDVFGGELPDKGDTLVQARLAASDLASEAKRRTRANPGLDYQTALHQAFEESKARGDWESVKAGTWFSRESKKYNPKNAGALPENAIPATKETEFEAGKYYCNSTGQVGKWNGKGMVLEEGPPARAAAPPPSAPVESDDDEEEND
jgi:hypothetical protein